MKFSQVLQAVLVLVALVAVAFGARFAYVTWKHGQKKTGAAAADDLAVVPDSNAFAGGYDPNETRTLPSAQLGGSHTRPT